MEILVCIKGGTPSDEMGRLDALALETALVLKERSLPHCPVDLRVAGVGPGCDPLLRRALGMGADRAFCLHPARGALSSLDIARALASAAGNARFILTGLQSETRMSGSVGPLIAGILGYPSLMGVVSLHWDKEGRAVVAERELEGGLQEQFFISSPCVMGVQSGALTARYPSLGRMLVARKANIPILDAPAPEGPKMVLGEQRPPDSVRAGENWSGSPEETAGRFHQWLGERQYL